MRWESKEGTQAYAPQLILAVFRQLTDILYFLQVIRFIKSRVNTNLINKQKAITCRTVIKLTHIGLIKF